MGRGSQGQSAVAYKHFSLFNFGQETQQWVGFLSFLRHKLHVAACSQPWVGDWVWPLPWSLGSCPWKRNLVSVCSSFKSLTTLLQPPLTVHSRPQLKLCLDGSDRCGGNAGHPRWPVALGINLQRMRCEFSSGCLEREKVLFLWLLLHL